MNDGPRHGNKYGNDDRDGGDDGGYDGSMMAMSMTMMVMMMATSITMKATMIRRGRCKSEWPHQEGYHRGPRSGLHAGDSSRKPWPPPLGSLSEGKGRS